MKNQPTYLTPTERILTTVLNIAVLVSSLLLIASLSYDILTTNSYTPTSPLTLTVQLWVCVIFLIDFVVRVSISHNRWLYVRRNFLQLLFSIPYLNIVLYLSLNLPVEVHYMLGFVPLLRGGYGLVMIARWFTKYTTTSLMVSYLTILVVVTYFTSLIFFVVEQGVNPLVHRYWDALWWACMDMTTVGSNVVAVTPIGKVLSVVLAASGMMMLPIFTVYITDKVQRIHKNERAVTKAVTQSNIVQNAPQKALQKISKNAPQNSL